jgi:tRNA(Arg) A34 adenosine deaminase TadA
MATVHAEQNAITDCAKRGVSCADATAYITHYPCINCMKMLCAAGIKNIKYTKNYNNDSLVEYFSNVSGVNITKMNPEHNFPPPLYISSSGSPEQNRILRRSTCIPISLTGSYEEDEWSPPISDSIGITWSGPYNTEELIDKNV